MKYRSTKKRNAFTLIEIIYAMLMAGIVVLAIGVLLADSQKGYNTIYENVFGNVATDAYAAQKAFEAVSRKASTNRIIVGTDKDWVELYYYEEGSTSAIPDRYARFYSSENQLIVEHGNLFPGTYTPDPGIESMSILLARNLESVEFTSTGTSVQMILKLDDGTNSCVITSSATRHNH